MRAVNLVEALEALVVEHERIGSPLRERLRPGPSAEGIEAVARRLGLALPSEVLELFSWRDIVDIPGETSRITWFWPSAPLRLDEVTETYRRSVDIGGISAEELERVELEPYSTFTGFWRTDWLPILYADPEYYAAECRPEINGPGRAPVWRVCWHPDDSFQTALVAPSLAAFVGRIVDLFRAGAYAWSIEAQDVVTVDAVFERLGLGRNYRPWP